jgi:hypothetical protein
MRYEAERMAKRVAVRKAERVYEWFLELPVPMRLGVLWLVVAGLLSLFWVSLGTLLGS